MMDKSDIIWAIGMILLPAAVVGLPLIWYLSTI